LRADERHSLALWLNELEYDVWDRQIVRDFLPGDRGEALFDKMKREIADALAIPFEMGRHKRYEAALTRTHWRTLRA